jgi:ESCRT-I complex subunit VPS37
LKDNNDEQEAEEESEVMVDMFMANGSSMDEFLEQYKEKRKLAHMRRIKIDKMRELLAAKKVPVLEILFLL